jgi:ubiquinone/menaquinone biosynthesis C-methylase UbiE
MSFNENIAPGFTAPDKASDPSYYVSFLKATDALEDVPVIRESMRQQMRLQPGHQVLDIGCGLGSETKVLAKIVGEKGRAVGLDVAEIMVKTARDFAQAERLNNVDFQVGDVSRLNFGDHTFNSCRSERVFMYLKDPRQSLAEMIRVTQPGGRVVIYDFDWDCFWVTTSDQAVTRRIHRHISSQLPNGHIGSQLLELFAQASLKDIQFVPRLMRFTYDFYQQALGGLITTAVTSGAVSENEVRIWQADLKNLEAEKRFFSGMQGFAVGGTKV